MRKERPRRRPTSLYRTVSWLPISSQRVTDVMRVCSHVRNRRGGGKGVSASRGVSPVVGIGSSAPLRSRCGSAWGLSDGG